MTARVHPHFSVVLQPRSRSLRARSSRRYRFEFLNSALPKYIGATHESS
jgi:hypothetical protein